MKTEKIVSKFFDVETSQQLRDYDIYKSQQIDTKTLDLNRYKETHQHLEQILGHPPTLFEKVDSTLSETFDDLLIVTILPLIVTNISLLSQSQIRVVKQNLPSDQSAPFIHKTLQSLAILLADDSRLISGLIRDFSLENGHKSLYLTRFFNKFGPEATSSTTRLLKALNLELMCTAYQTVKYFFAETPFAITDIGAAWKTHIHIRLGNSNSCFFDLTEHVLKM